MSERNRPGRIVVGVDGSLGSLEALRRAVHAARATGRALDVVRVWRPTVCSYTKSDYSITNPEVARRERHSLADAVARALGRRPEDVELRTQVRAYEGNAGKLLVWLADAESDLLMIGSSRRRRLSGLAVGSVGRYCVRHARCALLVVPLPEFARSVGYLPFHGKRLVRTLTGAKAEASLRP